MAEEGRDARMRGEERDRTDDLAGENPPQLESDIDDEGANLPAGEAADRRGPVAPEEELLPPDA
jgi:hypothetical protein